MDDVRTGFGWAIPEISPFRVSDLSKSAENLLTSSGFNGGTLTGPVPLEDGGGDADGGRWEASMLMPVNLGSGPAIVVLRHID